MFEEKTFSREIFILIIGAIIGVFSQFIYQAIEEHLQKPDVKLKYSAYTLRNATYMDSVYANQVVGYYDNLRKCTMLKIKSRTSINGPKKGMLVEEDFIQTTRMKFLIENNSDETIENLLLTARIDTLRGMEVYSTPNINTTHKINIDDQGRYQHVFHIDRLFPNSFGVITFSTRLGNIKDGFMHGAIAMNLYVPKIGEVQGIKRIAASRLLNLEREFHGNTFKLQQRYTLTAKKFDSLITEYVTLQREGYKKYTKKETCGYGKENPIKFGNGLIGNFVPAPN